eukprot:TRINITY_DN9822_c0_g1_i1.p1 TRINITY_DN9822_c0_g1~~TRINITY_DN9822_c0_g1_i1.p1  ORF type:complete len:1130 (+),score=290.71 TRINITY_DN9822_c0_g1_i1:77-3466(+)
MAAAAAETDVPKTSDPAPEAESEATTALEAADAGAAPQTADLHAKHKAAAAQAAQKTQAPEQGEMPRIGLKQASMASMEEAGDTVPVDELVRRAKAHMKQTACTIHNEETGEYEFRPLWGTCRTQLGVYGVGVELYFRLLKSMGSCFFLLLLVSLPGLIIYVQGNMVQDANQLYMWMGRLCVANLGYCLVGDCRSEEEKESRCLTKDCQFEVRDVTEWIGLLDGVAILLFMVFYYWFSHWYLPKTVLRNDAKFVTPADYAVQVHGLPRRLKEDHDQYEKKLKEHFMDVLRAAGPVEEDSVQEITIVRDYNGGVSRFMEKGQLVKQLVHAKEAARRHRASGNDKAAKKHEKLEEKKSKRIESIDKRLDEQAKTQDLDRDVCTAFVMFSKERYKESVIQEYRFAASRMLRLCQSRRMRFGNHRISVAQACEPSDLYWENLDFSHAKRACRVCIVLVVTIVLLLVCTTLLVAAQSVQKTAAPTVPEVRTWVIRQPDVDGPQEPLKLCNVKFFSSPLCNERLATSEDWPVAKVYNSEGAGDVAVLQAHPGCDVSASSIVAISNLALTGSQSSDKDWLAVEFESPEAANCMTVTYPSTQKLPALELFACRSDMVPAEQEGIRNWKPEQSCIPMETLLPQTVAMSAEDLAATASVSSGRMSVRLDTSCRHNVSFQVAEEAKAFVGAATSAQDPTVNCYCQKQVEQKGYNFRLPPYKTDESKLCAEWSYSENMKLGRLVGGVLVVAFLNQALLFVYQWLIDWERHGLVSDVTQSQMFKLFLAQFVNTGMLVILVNFNLKYGSLLEYVEFLGIGKGAYDDVSAAWFIAIGTSIIITIAMQIISTTLPPLAMSFIVTPLMTRFMSRSVVTQESLNDIYMLPQWNLALRLAQSLNVFFCIMMYSAGMPVLYSVGGLYCLVAYWMDKICLLWGSHRPPAYKEHVVKAAVNLFPAAAFLHAFFALWTFGKQSLFPSDWSVLTPLFEAVLGLTREESESIIFEYQVGSQERQSSLFGDYMLVLLAYYILHMLWGMLLKPFLSPFVLVLKECVTAHCSRRNKGADMDGQLSEGTTIKLQDAIPQMEKHGLLTSYGIAKNHRYRDAYIALSLQDGLVLDRSAAGPSPEPAQETIVDPATDGANC